ncbi:MAG: AarF/UbiB family protein, partial [Chloroflexi bacterium]|nr:AarF/UbiB family protein [Chloroflexota bacterium]
KNGDVVAVKVQRPGIAKLIAVDLEILLSIANLMERHTEEARSMNLSRIVQEFSASIKRELDFRLEVNNLRRFAHNFAGDPQIRIPRTYDELCTSRVIVMEYMQGIDISNRDRLVAEGYDLRVIASRGVDIAMKSAMEHGFFHADPHPGNIIVLPGNIICLLDFGMMGILSPHDRESLAKLVSSIVSRDDKAMARALVELSDPDTRPRVEDLELDVWNLAQQYLNLPLSQLSMGDFLRQLLQLIRTHHLRFRSHFVWLLKAIATIEIVARRLYPDFNMIQSTTPHARRLLRHRFSLTTQARELRYVAIDLLEFMKVLPVEGRDILRQLREGQVKIEFEHLGLAPMRQTIDRTANRLVLAIVIAALIVGASLVVRSEVPPLVSGIPVISLIGYIIAALLGIGLASAVYRSRRP